MLSMGNAHFDSVLARKLSTFLPLSPNEMKCLAELQFPARKVKRGRQLVHEGQSGHQVFVLQSGWACSYKNLSSGGRQIISFPIAGDCVGLRSILMRTADHSLEVVTDAVVSAVDGARILQTFSEFPRVGAAILWCASRDEAMVVEHLVSIGRRSALERTAHFFMELAERLDLIGVAVETEFECPLNQYVIADALGLTAIHVNRVLRQLRERGLLTVQRGKVRVHNARDLRNLSGFRVGYLNARDDNNSDREIHLV
jgi:CRP-like cAMP-binding protein